MRKNIILTVISLFMVLTLFVGCSSQKVDEKNVVSKEKIEVAVKNVLLDESNTYIKESDGTECPVEGHIIMGYDKTKSGYKVYALTLCGAYGFENGNFVFISGTGLIPAVISFDNELNFNDIEYPKDGADYSKSIKKMFPKKYVSRALAYSESDVDELEKQKKYYAEKYLIEIGRDAKIGEHIDFNDSYKLLTDVGVSVDVSNLLSETLQKYSNDYYPYWIGNKEIIKDTVRYVLSQNYDSENNKIIYTKSVYDTKEVVEEFVFDSKTGLEIK